MTNNRGDVRPFLIQIALRCLVQDNCDGSVTCVVPTLSCRAFTGDSIADAMLKATRELNEAVDGED